MTQSIMQWNLSGQNPYIDGGGGVRGRRELELPVLTHDDKRSSYLTCHGLSCKA